MKILIVIVIAFLVLLYVYTYLKYRKGKSNKIDTINDFHSRYLKENTSSKRNTTQSDNRTNYITRYNSKVDYVEKDKFKL